MSIPSNDIMSELAIENFRRHQRQHLCGLGLVFAGLGC